MIPYQFTQELKVDHDTSQIIRNKPFIFFINNPEPLEPFKLIISGVGMEWRLDLSVSDNFNHKLITSIICFKENPTKRILQIFDVINKFNFPI